MFFTRAHSVRLITAFHALMRARLKHHWGVSSLVVEQRRHPVHGFT
jgi:hypothetical protein